MEWMEGVKKGRCRRRFRTLSSGISLAEAGSPPQLKCDCRLMKHDSLTIGKASHSRLQSLEFSLPGGK